jgi:hypothetical protein
MIHPFMPDLSNKSTDELQTTMSDLTGKLTFAYRTSNTALVGQLQMVIEGYRTEINKRLDDLYRKQKLENQVSISSAQKNL